VSVWSWRGHVADLGVDGASIVVTMADGARHAHVRTSQGWHVDLLTGTARSSIDLGGLAEELDSPSLESAAPGEVGPEPIEVPRVKPGVTVRPASFPMAEEHYRRSEQSWREAGAPTARVSLHAEEAVLCVDVEVSKGGPVVIRDRRDNELDNEHADVNVEGVQVYLREGDAAPRGWLIALEAGGGTRISAVAGSPRGDMADARWRETADGYLVSVRITLSSAVTGGRSSLDVLVNETVPGRERRRGQLVLSGARGEFVYLRGDRQPADRLIPFVLVDA
jgi:hypothetical protein